ncbi:MAG: pyrroline-5-carboxylate reductase [Candidatus Gastranaerophilaceae bacterium]|jgi:pyrroline-5-carboxylate reductase
MFYKKIGFIGAGKMGGAIIKGLISSGFIAKESIFVSEPNKEIAKYTEETLEIKVFHNNKQLADSSDIIVLAVKPFMIKTVLEEIKEYLTDKKLIISIAAGITTSFIQEIAGNIPVIRVMPNTPALVSEGMSAICRGKFASDEQIEDAEKIFSKVGKCIEVTENLIDVVTGISGSGPAFAYTIMEALADGGVKLGLPKSTALILAAQTMLGSAKMVLETGKHPSILKDEVTTPGGCTAEGLAVLEDNNIRSVLIKTVEKTAKKAFELGNKK